MSQVALRTMIVTVVLGVIASIAAGPAAAALAIPNSATELIVVSGRAATRADHLATLSAFTRRRPGARWMRVLGPWSAEIGRAGLRRDRHEGDGSTPIGVFSIGSTIFGNDRDPGGLRSHYRQLRCGDWWDEDPFSGRYNHFVSLPCHAVPTFGGDSEALWLERRAYPYFAVIDFNEHPVLAGHDAPGSGIFLHSWVGGATAGCVAVRRRQLLAILRWLRPADNPMIALRPASPRSSIGAPTQRSRGFSREPRHDTMVGSRRGWRA